MNLRIVVTSHVIVAFAFVTNRCTGQVPSIGSCPIKKSLQSVDFRKLTGVWYELERTPSIAEWPYKCITFKLQPFFEQKSSLTVTAVNRFTEKLETHIVPLRIPAESEATDDGRIMANMTSNGISVHSTAVQVLATDNSTSSKWFIAWSCRDFETAKIRTESLWIFSNHREPEESTWLEIRDALRNLKLEHTVLRETIQSDCRGKGKDEEEGELINL